MASNFGTGLPSESLTVSNRLIFLDQPTAAEDDVTKRTEMIIAEPNTTRRGKKNAPDFFGGATYLFEDLHKSPHFLIVLNRLRLKYQ